MARKLVIEFDIDRYLRNSKRLDLSGLDWDEIPNHPLSRRRRDVPPLHDGHRDAHGHLPARPARDARRARSLRHRRSCPAGCTRSSGTARRSRTSCARTGSRCRPSRSCPTGARRCPPGPNRVTQFREQMGVGHKLFLLPTMFGSMVMRDFVALHMTWGAINELTTLTRLLPAQAPLEPPCAAPDARPHHPGRAAPLRLLPRAGEGADDRATRAPAALVRRALEGVLDAGRRGREVAGGGRRAALYLFGDSPEGREGVREIDGTIAELPGLEGLTLLEDVLDAALERAARQPGYAGMVSETVPQHSSNGAARAVQVG